MISPVWANTLIFVGSMRNMYGVICCSYMYVAFLTSLAPLRALSPLTIRGDFKMTARCAGK